MEKNIILKNFYFSPSVNQLAEVTQLIREICRRENKTEDDIITWLKDNCPPSNKDGQRIFPLIKNLLIQRRFPLTSCRENIEAKNVFLSRSIHEPIKIKIPNQNFTPEKIFIEESVQKSELAHNFTHMFPDIKPQIISRLGEYIKTHKYTISNLKDNMVFIVQEKYDFIKPCPCTPQHVSCGYWILNLGFGCPYDCSYCYLQQYANVPGIILPANLDDFFTAFDKINKNLSSPIRIGTGEFTDSLALDHLTQYSKKLIPYFTDKNVMFELKTKSANIDNLLQIKAPKNIIISWSLNRSEICRNEELGTASLEERLQAANKCQKHGYNIAFHFDPIIHSDDWQEAYKKTIDMIYTYVTPPFSWISLGTLRCQRDLKTISQQRFSESNIFYGELLLGKDKKLRYPQFIRENIYDTMIKLIKTHDSKTLVYLCMENNLMWETTKAQKP